MNQLDQQLRIKNRENSEDELIQLTSSSSQWGPRPRNQPKSKAGSNNFWRRRAGGVDLSWSLARLPVATTLTELELRFYDYDLTHRDNRRTAQPICDCLANLWREYHPLRKLKLCSTIDEDDAQLASTQRCPSTILYRCETIRDRPPEVGQCTL
jgi:hypothetical protein